MTTRITLPIAAAATVSVAAALSTADSPAPAPGQSIREQTLAAHLERITAAEDWFFTMNEHGTAAEFQRAADEFHDAVQDARDYLAR